MCVNFATVKQITVNMKPYIISHMMTSVDGRIDCPMVGQLGTDEYYVALEKLGPCSKLSGRVTGALECSAVSADTEPEAGNATGHESVHVACSSDEYTIVTDTRGRLRWQSAEADGHPLLCIVSEQVSDNYLNRLRALCISWIATGRERIDLPRAMELLHDDFGVERLAVVGGGHICGGFLEAGLLDEVSIMIGPGIDGRAGETAVFDGVGNPTGTPFRLKLDTVERWETDIVWLRYKTVK